MKRLRSSVTLFGLGVALVVTGAALLVVGTGTVRGSDGDQTVDSTDPLAPFSDFACLDCHTSESALRELAVVPEEDAHKALSSGPG